MNQSKTRQCCTCGYEWPRYTSGSHSCSERLRSFVDISQGDPEGPVWVPLAELLAHRIEFLAPDGRPFVSLDVAMAFLLARQQGTNVTRCKLAAGSLVESPFYPATAKVEMPVGDRWHSTNCPECKRVLMVKNRGTALCECGKWKMEVGEKIILTNER